MTTGIKVRPRSFTGRNAHLNLGFDLETGVTSVLSQGSDQNFPISTVDGVVWEGDDRPDYRRVIAEGGGALNDFIGSRVRTVCEPSTTELFTEQRQWYGDPPSYRPLYRNKAWNTTYHAVPDPGAPSHNGEAYRVATQVFTRQARQRLNEANALITAGELRESIQLVLNAKRRVLGQLQKFQITAKKRVENRKYRPGRSNARILKDASRSLSETWLEYSFGWRPLVNDVTDLARAAAKAAAGTNRSYTIRAKGASSSTEDLGAGWVSNGPNGPTIDARCRSVTESYAYIYGVMDLHVGDPGEYSTSFGTDMDNWIPSLWELIPWSFAVDYFTGIGDYISAMTFPWTNFRFIGLTRVSNDIRELHDWRLTQELVSTDEATVTAKLSPGVSQRINEIMDRQPWDRSIPMPHFRVPGFASAYVNLAALGTLRVNNSIDRRALGLRI